MAGRPTSTECFTKSVSYLTGTQFYLYLYTLKHPEIYIVNIQAVIHLTNWVFVADEARILTSGKMTISEDFMEFTSSGLCANSGGQI